MPERPDIEGAPWPHAEAKKHTVIERLYERCSVYGQDNMPCPEQGSDLPREDWCERCLAATRLEAIEALVAGWEAAHTHLGVERHHYGPSSSALRAVLSEPAIRPVVGGDLS